MKCLRLLTWGEGGVKNGPNGSHLPAKYALKVNSHQHFDSNLYVLVLLANGFIGFSSSGILYA